MGVSFNRPRRSVGGLVALLAALLLAVMAMPALAASPGMAQNVYYGYYDLASRPYDAAGGMGIQWDQALAAGQYPYANQTGGYSSSGQQANGFFDWFTDFFDWFDDKKDEVTGNKYDDAGIPHDAFFWSYYGMNVQNVDTMSRSDFAMTLNYAGPWLRINMHTDEVAEQNWYRLEPALRNLRAAAASTGISPNLVINLSGYSNAGSGDDYLLRGLSWDEKAERYADLAYTLTEKVHSLGWGDAIFEAWNEPDNSSASLGIGPGSGSAEFKTGLTKLLDGFSEGVRRGGGLTAFSPFMTLNDTKIDVVRSVWQSVQGGYDYFSAHQYDDDPGKVKYWAKKTKEFTGNRPVIISEHGYQSSPKDADKYRRQAWALYQGFGADTLKGVMGYVYASNHQPWAISSGEDFFWKVTHDSRP